MKLGSCCIYCTHNRHNNNSLRNTPVCILSSTVVTPGGLQQTSFLPAWYFPEFLNFPKITNYYVIRKNILSKKFFTILYAIHIVVIHLQSCLS